MWARTAVVAVALVSCYGPARLVPPPRPVSWLSAMQLGGRPSTEDMVGLDVAALPGGGFAEHAESAYARRYPR